MHRALFIASFALFALTSQLSAQHGGGHGFAGGHGGMSGHGISGHGISGRGMSGHGGFASHSGRSFTGSRGPGFSSRSSFPGSASRRVSSRNFNRFRGSRIRTRGFRNNCFGFGCQERFGFPWWYAGQIDPYWWWDSGSSYDEDRQREIGMANEMNAQSLEEQRMRQEGDQDIYARTDPPSARAAQSPEVIPATVLVFRDQRKKEVQNYAIVGQTLWNFAPQHTEKISLDDLDLPATTKANDDRGVDFHVPGA